MSESQSFIIRASGFLERVNRSVLAVERVAGGLLMGFMLLIVTINILSRYVMTNPVFWGEELASFTFAWMALVASAYALGREMHIRITMLVDYMPRKVKMMAEVFNYVIGIATFCIFLPYSILVMRHLVPSPAMRIPEQYIYCIVPIVFSLFIFHMVVSLFRTLVNLKKGV